MRVWLLEDMRMKEALTKPEVQQVLTDPDIQHLINLLKDKADEAQRYAPYFETLQSLGLGPFLL